MREISYCYDKQLKKWQTGANCLVSPIFSEIKRADRKVWCKRHHIWEDIIGVKTNSVFTKNSCTIKGPFIENNTIVPYAYTLKTLDGIGLTTLLVYEKGYYEGEKRSFEHKFTFSVNNGGYSEEKSVSDKAMPIPQDVLSDIMGHIGEMLKKKVGIQPIPTTKIKNVDAIKAFIEFPFNNNFYFLTCIGGFSVNTINRLNPESTNEMYDVMGVKPFKTLRKKYEEDPFAPIVFKIMQQIGFTDINIIFALLQNNFKTYLKEHWINFDSTSKQFSFAGYEDFDFFCKEALKCNKEKVVINALKKTFEKNVFVEDCLRMFHLNFSMIEREDRKRIFHDGFDNYIHNILSKLVHYEKDVEPFVFNDFVAALQWEDEKSGYRFCLPHDSSTLQKIGSQMNNCVGSYSHAVRNGTSIIIGVIRKNKWVICIEISPNFELRQALGPHNIQLQGNDLKIVKDWAAKNHIDTKGCYYVCRDMPI